MSYISLMKDRKDHKIKAISFKVTEEDYMRIRKVLGPYGSITRLLRDVIRQYLDKVEKKSNAA